MNFNQKVTQWQHPPFDATTQKEVTDLLTNPKELEDAFYKDLELKKKILKNPLKNYLVGIKLEFCLLNAFFQTLIYYY